MTNTHAGESKKDDPADVARQGYEALMAGRDHVVAGSLMNNMMAGIAKVVPEKVGAALQGMQTKPNDLTK